MNKRPISLTPPEAQVLARCPLHYHFLQQRPTRPSDAEQARLDHFVREAIQTLHAAGGPARLSLRACLEPVQTQRAARQMVERYYHRLEGEWATMMASNETMHLRLSLGGVPLALEATVDRLDKTSDGGILGILFRTEPPPVPTASSLRRDHAITIYHALVAATYPAKRPVRIQELWLRTNETVTVELSEAEYRRNLSDLREPVQGLGRGEVMARPGLHCDTCPFKHHGCPVYAHEVTDEPQEETDDLGLAPPDGKISPRQWTFKI